MNRRILTVAVVLFTGFFSVLLADSRPLPQQAARKAINLPGKAIAAPFSDAILSGNTLYLAGRLGLDKDGKVPEKVDDEIKLLLDGEKDVLAQAGMTMDDLVYVQISCTDLKLFDTFNPIYKTYFTKDFPAREFVGAGSLLRGAHFELQAIAVKR